jgi:hypothetical protein
VAAATYNLAIEQGATFSAQITWNDSDGDPVDLTGYTAELDIRSGPASDTELLELTNGSGLTLGGAAGTVDIVITAAQTSALPAGRLAYDLLLTTGSTKTRLVEGKAIVSPAVTR